mgnify:CR=1 FL=1
MLKLYNFVIYLFSKIILSILIFKKVRVYNLLINLSIGKFKYSRYGIKLINQNMQEKTYRFCLGGAYGFFFSNYLKEFKKNFILLDFGANIGLYSCIAAKNNNCNYIYSFEPIKIISEILKKNLKLNCANAKVFNYGIYSKNIQKKIYFDPFHTGQSSLLKKENKNFKRKIICKFINSKKIDKFIPIKPIDYIVKIDVEGLEKIVLKELMSSKIFKNVKSIYIEINNPKDFSIIKKNLSKFNFKFKGPFVKQLTKDYLFIKNES